MSGSKEKILGRIRDGLKNGGPAAERELGIKRNYIRSGQLSAEDRLHQFVERVSEYRAVVDVVGEEELAERIAAVCAGAGVSTLVVPPGLDDAWLAKTGTDAELLFDEPEPLSKEQLNATDAVLTGAAIGVSQTGTIILDAGPGQGRRALTLLPDFHICVVREDQVVELLPEAFEKLEPVVKESGRTVTFISGPSATSDIELNRVEGVHGPRRLHVLVVKG